MSVSTDQTLLPRHSRCVSRSFVLSSLHFLFVPFFFPFFLFCFLPLFSHISLLGKHLLTSVCSCAPTFNLRVLRSRCTVFARWALHTTSPPSRAVVSCEERTRISNRNIYLEEDCFFSSYFLFPFFLKERKGGW